jgi:hypothetical protein
VPTGVFEITDIPENRVDMVIREFQLDNPQKIETKPQGGGLFTVVATFPGPGKQKKTFES